MTIGVRYTYMIYTTHRTFFLAMFSRDTLSSSIIRFVGTTRRSRLYAPFILGQRSFFTLLFDSDMSSLVFETLKQSSYEELVANTTSSIPLSPLVSSTFIAFSIEPIYSFIFYFLFYSFILYFFLSKK